MDAIERGDPDAAAASSRTARTEPFVVIGAWGATEPDAAVQARVNGLVPIKPTPRSNADSKTETEVGAGRLSVDWQSSPDEELGEFGYRTWSASTFRVL